MFGPPPELGKQGRVPLDDLLPRVGFIMTKLTGWLFPGAKFVIAVLPAGTENSQFDAHTGRIEMPSHFRT